MSEFQNSRSVTLLIIQKRWDFRRTSFGLRVWREVGGNEWLHNINPHRFQQDWPEYQTKTSSNILILAHRHLHSITTTRSAQNTTPWSFTTCFTQDKDVGINIQISSEHIFCSYKTFVMVFSLWHSSLEEKQWYPANDWHVWNPRRQV